MKKVTRTITTTAANCLVADAETREFKEISFLLSGTYKDNAAIAKAIGKLTKDSSVTLMEIISTSENEQLYACTEDEFLSVAKPVPAKA